MSSLLSESNWRSPPSFSNLQADSIRLLLMLNKLTEEFHETKSKAKYPKFGFQTQFYLARFLTDFTKSLVWRDQSARLNLDFNILRDTQWAIM